MDLDWQLSFNVIKDRGLHLLQTAKLSDCCFLVGIAPSQKIIAGHRLILAMASPVFESMFFGQLAEKDSPIVIPDVLPEAFETMLEYIYSDRIMISSFDKACELCYVAKKYMLPHVVEQCTQYLSANLSTQNACRAYEFAKLFDEPRLMQSSMEVIVDNTAVVLDDPNFTDIEVSTLMAILDQDKLDIESELDLFNAVLRFANERGVVANGTLHNQNIQNNPKSLSGNSNGGSMMLHVEQNQKKPKVNVTVQLDEDEVKVEGELQNQVAAGAAIVAPHEQPSTSNAVNVDYFMNPQRLSIDESMIRQAVRKVRFLTMTPRQFAAVPARSKLLKPQEALAIFIKICSPANNGYPTPEGFSSSLSCRNCFEDDEYNENEWCSSELIYQNDSNSDEGSMYEQ